ncbi:hypothetical protein GQ42DRAFT_161475 [Ramicandelaber brevisporus]|nr:hypothetical protein GQ42DRAFT_161475 [Ramicandelaber brevisporus]
MMGTPNMDFFVRETRAVVHGPMCIIRLGSCGGIGDGSVGDVAVADSAVAISRNFDAFTADAAAAAAEPPYLISKPVAADAGLTASLKANIEAAIAHQAGALDSKVVVGLNATADSFYSSQGRTDTAFDDRNEALFDAIRTKYPAAQTLEMETFMLYHLAQCATPVAVSVEGTAGAPQLAVAKSTSYMITPTPSIPSSGDTTPELRPAAEPAAAAAAAATEVAAAASTAASSIKASAAMIIFAGRKSNAFITPDRVSMLQAATGRAVLKTLAEAVL